MPNDVQSIISGNSNTIHGAVVAQVDSFIFFQINRGQVIDVNSLDMYNNQFTHIRHYTGDADT
jgi:hypothetical protein